MPGSHRDIEDPRERDDEGVVIALADTALREAGGLASKIESYPLTAGSAELILSGAGRRPAISLFNEGDSLGPSI